LLFMYRTVCYVIISLDFCYYFRNFATANPNQHEKTVLQKKTFLYCKLIYDVAIIVQDY
jgi:hypothetical protein